MFSLLCAINNKNKTLHIIRLCICTPRLAYIRSKTTSELLQASCRSRKTTPFDFKKGKVNEKEGVVSFSRDACGKTHSLYNCSSWQHYIQLFSQVFFKEHNKAVSVILSLTCAFQIVPSVPWNAGAIARPGKAPLDALISKWQTAKASASWEILS